MEYRVRVNLLSTATVVAIGIVVSLVTSTLVASRAYHKKAQLQRGEKQTLTVKGYARQRARSDQAVWHIEVLGEAPELQDAFEILDRSVARALEFLAERGFADDEVLLQAIETNAHYVKDEHGKATRAVESYSLSRVIGVATLDVERVADASAEVTALIRDNIRVHSRVPEFTLSQVGEIKIDLLGAASADARRRAEEIAVKSGCQVGEVRDARMGVIQITQPHSTDVRSYGIYDTRTIAKDVSVVMTITFRVE